MEWFNQPASSEIENFQSNESGAPFSSLRVKALGHSDYWRKTHNGLIRDNGHFLHVNVSRNFEAFVSVSGQYKSLYDHGGLMVRIDSENWVKAGIEYVEGILNISAVVTRDFSDWSVIHLENPQIKVHFKIKWVDGSFEVFYSIDGEKYIMYRVSYLPKVENVQVGIMCASPESDDGFDIQFDDFRLKYLE